MTNNSAPPGKPYVYAFSSGRLVLLVCMVLLLVALSFMLGIRIERYQQSAKLAAFDSMRETPPKQVYVPVETVQEPEPEHAEAPPPTEPAAIPIQQPRPEQKAVPKQTAPKQEVQKPVAQKPVVQKQEVVTPPKPKEKPKPAPPKKLVEPLQQPKKEKKAVVKEAPKVIPKEPPPPAPKKVEATGLNYAIQIASSQDKALAESQRNILNKKGFASYIEVIDLAAKGRFYRVMVGPFQTKAEATNVQKQLTKDPTFADCYVRQLP